MDVLGLYVLPDADMAEAFSAFDPRQMMISRDRLELNSAMALQKDHVVGVCVLTEDPQ